MQKSLLQIFLLCFIFSFSFLGLAEEESASTIIVEDSTKLNDKKFQEVLAALLKGEDDKKSSCEEDNEDYDEKRDQYFSLCKRFGFKPPLDCQKELNECTYSQAASSENPNSKKLCKAQQKALSKKSKEKLEDLEKDSLDLTSELQELETELKQLQNAAQETENHRAESANQLKQESEEALAELGEDYKIQAEKLFNQIETLGQHLSEIADSRSKLISAYEEGKKKIKTDCRNKAQAQTELVRIQLFKDAKLKRLNMKSLITVVKNFNPNYKLSSYSALINYWSEIKKTQENKACLTSEGTLELKKSLLKSYKTGLELALKKENAIQQQQLKIKQKLNNLQSKELSQKQQKLLAKFKQSLESLEKNFKSQIQNNRTEQESQIKAIQLKTQELKKLGEKIRELRNLFNPAEKALTTPGDLDLDDYSDLVKFSTNFETARKTALGSCCEESDNLARCNQLKERNKPQKKADNNKKSRRNRESQGKN